MPPSGPCLQLHELLGRFSDKSGGLSDAAQRDGSTAGGTGLQAQDETRGQTGGGRQAGSSSIAACQDEVDARTGGAAGRELPAANSKPAGAAEAGGNSASQTALAGKGASKPLAVGLSASNEQ